MVNTTNYLGNASQNENEALLYLQGWLLFKKTNKQKQEQQKRSGMEMVKLQSLCAATRNGK